jgi:hypothetical protein
VPGAGMRLLHLNFLCAEAMCYDDFGHHGY